MQSWDLDPESLALESVLLITSQYCLAKNKYMQLPAHNYIGADKMVLFFSHVALQGGGVEKMVAQNNQGTTPAALEGFAILWMSGRKPDIGHVA